MLQFWLCQILIGISVSSVTLRIFPLAVLLLQNNVEGRERVIAF